jgi:hypothetical protein
MQVRWADVEATQGVRSRAVIESILAQAVTKGFPGVRLRPMLGKDSPPWAKAIGGGPITYTEPQGGSTITIPDLWDASFQLAAKNFLAWMAAQFDTDDRLLLVFATGAMAFYAEPCIRGSTNAANRTNLIAAGYTIAADKALQNAQLDWMDHFVETPIGLAYTPLQEIDSVSAQHTSVADMADIMDYHISKFGARTVLQNNSIRSSYVADPPDMYAEMIARNAYNLQFQCAGSTHIGSFPATMEWACDYLEASGVELVNGYPTKATDAQITDWDTRLQANGP